MYQKGDKVMCVDASGCSKSNVGDIYTVKNCYRYSISGTNTWYIEVEEFIGVLKECRVVPVTAQQSKQMILPIPTPAPSSISFYVGQQVNHVFDRSKLYVIRSIDYQTNTVHAYLHNNSAVIFSDHWTMFNAAPNSPNMSQQSQAVTINKFKVGDKVVLEKNRSSIPKEYGNNFTIMSFNPMYKVYQIVSDSHSNSLCFGALEEDLSLASSVVEEVKLLERGRCTCDFYNVLLAMGCQCGGT